MRLTDTDTRLRLYRMMYLVRRTEEILMEEYHPADEMRCLMHFCVGQEAMYGRGRLRGVSIRIQA
jgi:TPP-dependent pyruvate/acetoin dehydrogenase alpha subunit